MDNFVEISHVAYSYDTTSAIRDINLKIAKNELFGVIGPDGAGKTTLFRILATLLIPDEGTVNINGIDIVKNYKSIRNITGYMPGRFSLYMDLNVEENLSFFASVFKTTVEENYDLIKNIYNQLEPFKKRRAGKLSGGMKQKLALSCALIHKPEILILDEPTTGVDAVSRKEFWEMLSDLRSKGITIVVSTPYMDEAGLCDRVALINNGNIMQIDTPDNITNSFNKNLYSIKSDNIYSLLKTLRSYDQTISANPFGQEIHTSLKDNNIENLQKYLLVNNRNTYKIKQCKPGIEDCFMDLMNDTNSN